MTSKFCETVAFQEYGEGILTALDIAKKFKL